MGLRKQFILNQKDQADFKDSARAVTLGPLPAYTRTANNITADANGALPAQDGVTLVAGDSLLLDEQTAGADNGVYIVTAIGDGSNPFVLDRRSDFDTSDKITAGIRVPIAEGGFGGTVFKLLTPDPITINSTAIDFDVDSSPGTAVQQGLTWTFDGASQADADPGSGIFRADNATPSSATELYVDPFPLSGVSLNNFLLAQDTPGFVYLEQVDDPTRWLLFNVTGLTVAGAGYVKLQVSLDGVPPSFEIEDGKDISFAFLTAPAPPNDADAIHDNVAAEISAIAAKATPVAGDYLIIEDSADSDNKKSITMGDIDHDALTNFVANEHIDWTAASAGTIDPTNYVPGNPSVTGLPWSAGVDTTTFTAVVGVTNRYDHTFPSAITFPTAPVDGDEFAIKHVGDPAGVVEPITMTVGSAKAWEHVTSTDISTTSEDFNRKFAYAHWRFDVTSDTWKLLTPKFTELVWSIDPPASGSFTAKAGITNQYDATFTPLTITFPPTPDDGEEFAIKEVFSGSGGYPVTLASANSWEHLETLTSSTTSETFVEGRLYARWRYSASTSTWLLIGAVRVPSDRFEINRSITTTTAAETSLGLFFTLREDKGGVMTGTVIATDTTVDTRTKVWQFSMLFTRTGAESTTVVHSLEILNSPQVSVGGTPPPWTISADDDGAGTVRLRVTGEAATTIGWRINANIMESP